tara:strand:+ start:223 stop:1401 length:1179 start_codon:yes stop_codon:yes gene_type:complete
MINNKITREINHITNTIKINKKITEYNVHEPDLRNQNFNFIKKKIEKGWISYAGPDVTNFENKLKNITKSKYVLATSSGTSALHLALKALNVNKNDEILLNTLTFIATANAIRYCDANPHFLDVSGDRPFFQIKELKKYFHKSFHIDEKNNLINKKTKKNVRVIIITHFLGYVDDNIFELVKFLKKYNLYIIEDSAGALGSQVNKIAAGTIGDIGIYSFNGNKIVSTGGGGALLTNKKNFFETSKHLSTTAKIGARYDYNHDAVGFNYRMSNLSATLGILQLNKLNIFLRNKKKLHHYYYKQLQGLDYFHFDYYNSKKNNHNFWINLLIMKNTFKSDYIIKKFIKRNIKLKRIWKPINHITPYQTYRCMNKGNNALNHYSKYLQLPSSSFLI